MRTLGLPGTGLYKRDFLDGRGDRSRDGRGARRSRGGATEVVALELSDATGGERELASDAPGVESLEVVEITRRAGSVEAIAASAGVTTRAARLFRHAALVPSVEEVTVTMLVHPDENPARTARWRRSTDASTPVEIGRLSARSARRFRSVAGDESVLGVVAIDTGLDRGRIEVRWRPALLGDEPAAIDPPMAPSPAEAEAPPAAPTALPPPAPPAGWYPDPEGEKRLRYFDGSRWTHHVAS